MDKVTVGSIADSKPSFVVAVQAAAVLTVGAGELVIAAGTTPKNVNNQRVVTALQTLRDQLREALFPVGPLAFTVITITPPGRAAVITNVAAIGVAHVETEIVIAYDSAFYDAGNSSNFLNIINRAIEVFQEQILKLN